MALLRVLGREQYNNYGPTADTGGLMQAASTKLPGLKQEVGETALLSSGEAFPQSFRDLAELVNMLRDT